MKSTHLLKTLVCSAFWVGGFACDDAREVIGDPNDTNPDNGGSDPLPQSSDSDPAQTNCKEASTVVGTHGQLQVVGSDLKDACGNYLQLKGISSYWLNWEGNGYAESKTALQWMIDNWHITVIRAAMGIDNATGGNQYMDSEAIQTKLKKQVTTIVDNAIALGIYVIIDWHSHNAEESAQTAESVAFFTEMAQKYGGYPNVLYETYNEPLQVDWDTKVKPYHQKVVNAIRAVDPDNIIILGTPQWSQRVDVAVDSPVSGTNLMYTLHFYSCSHPKEIADNAWFAYNNGVPIFVTEWGATHSDGGLDGKVCEHEADVWMQTLNDMNASWTAWKLDGCNDSSCLLQTGAPTDGPWDNYLHGHATYVIGKLLEK